MPEKFSSILLVDDDPTTNHFNKLLLEEMNLSEKIHLAYDGKEALSLIRDTSSVLKDQQQIPSIIFLDLYMPMMNGFEFLEALKEREDWYQTYWVVLLTSSNQPADIERVNNFKVANILRKPLTSEKVRLVIREALKS
ncbi:response regulator [Nafulsella turpanensis]|uniref:response regulator n=1 Tax=Nafulsella turpanensis TaxID=1265690 RepID=UPI00035E029B|nr:response regulator [Nafulsella turpanensis]